MLFYVVYLSTRTRIKRSVDYYVPVFDDVCELLIIRHNIMVFSTVTLDAPALELRSCLSIHEAIDKAYQQGINAKYINQADLDEFASKGCKGETFHTQGGGAHEWQEHGPGHY